MPNYLAVLCVMLLASACEAGVANTQTDTDRDAGLIAASQADTAIAAAAFDQLAQEFVTDTQALALPDLDVSFVTNLERLGGPADLEKQQIVFASYKQKLVQIDETKLDICRRIELSQMRTETAFGQRRADLGLRYLALAPDIGEAQSLADIAMGAQWYSFFLDRWNGAALDANQIFAFGEEQLRRSVARYDGLQREMGFANDSEGLARHLASAAARLDDDAATRALFMKKQARVWDNLGKLFPASHGVARATIERSDRGDSFPVPGYYNPDEQTFYYNVLGDAYDARQADWLLLHEATPGHHFQMSADRKNIRCDNKLTERFYPAYVEGWAAYSETLGEALGLYDTPEAKLAAIEWDMVRSVRVALDVALNAYGWSDEKALAYWRRHVRGQEDIAMREIKRMKRWPAQVVTYKYGADVFARTKAAYIEIKNAAEATRAFHDAAISYGSMPLATFEELAPAMAEHTAAASD